LRTKYAEDTEKISRLRAGVSGTRVGRKSGCQKSAKNSEAMKPEIRSATLLASWLWNSPAVPLMSYALSPQAGFEIKCLSPQSVVEQETRGQEPEGEFGIQKRQRDKSNNLRLLAPGF
jgi:hypothetical protein